jgi:hypothetical protein
LKFKNKNNSYTRLNWVFSVLLHFSDGLMNTMGPATQQRLMEALLAVSQRKHPMLQESGFDPHLNQFMSPAPSYSKNQDGNAGEKKYIVDKYFNKKNFDGVYLSACVQQGIRQLNNTNSSNYNHAPISKLLSIKQFKRSFKLLSKPFLLR